jgi:methylenetetrahydrofolate reductase (NADPH)
MRDGARGDVASLLARARFELVPTKTVEQQIPFLPAGATVTVTSSPRRGPEPTIALVERLAALGFRAVPHLAARHVTGLEHLEAIAARLDRARIREVFVVGGDEVEPAGPFPSALSLLTALAEMDHGFEDVGVAGYPERHPLIDDATLLRDLLAKQQFATYLVTQICFDPRTIFAWASQVRGEGVDLPVYIGMPGVARRTKLLEISLRIGVGDSVRYLRKHGSLVRRLMGRSGYRPDGFVTGIASLLAEPAANVAGFHINSFNQVESTERWRREVLARHQRAELPAPLKEPGREYGIVP